MENEFEDFLQKLMNDEENPVRGELFVRALDYHESTVNNGLDFNFGDILEITHKPQKELWIARKVFPNGSKSEKGIIYSSEYQKQKRAEIFKLSGIKEPAFSYLVVQKHIDDSIRPIIVLGALKEKIMKSLMEKRPSLIGRIMSLSPNAIRGLHQANVFPIVIFNVAQNLQRIIDGEMSEEEAAKEGKEIMELAKEMPLFTKRFCGDDTFDDIVSLTLEHIDAESRLEYWIPSEDQSDLLC